MDLLWQLLQEICASHGYVPENSMHHSKTRISVNSRQTSHPYIHVTIPRILWGVRGDEHCRFEGGQRRPQPRHSTSHHLTHFLSIPLILTNWTFFYVLQKEGSVNNNYLNTINDLSDGNVITNLDNNDIIMKTTTTIFSLHLTICGHSNAIIVQDTWFETKMENHSDIISKSKQ
jgi:hypothetical protein